MAPKQKAKPAATKRRTTTNAAAPVPASRSITTSGGGGEPKQLMREAAWSRMFGRAAAKNPFTR